MTISRKQLVTEIAREVRLRYGSWNETAFCELIDSRDYWARAYDRWVGDVGDKQRRFTAAVRRAVKDRLRGYAPITRIMFDQNSVRNGKSHLAFVREGGAVAVTIDEKITGFRGYRRRWWNRADEIPFPEWQTADRRNRARVGT